MWFRTPECYWEILQHAEMLHKPGALAGQWSRFNQGSVLIKHEESFLSPTLHLHSGGTNPLCFFKSPFSASIRLGLSRQAPFWGSSFSSTKEGAARFWVPKPRTWRWDPNYLLWWLPVLPTACGRGGGSREAACTLSGWLTYCVTLK